jgi:hypothetical protein
VGKRFGETVLSAQAGSLMTDIAIEEMRKDWALMIEKNYQRRRYR